MRLWKILHHKRMRDAHQQGCCLFCAAACSSLCNDSSLSYQPGAGSYTRIGESTELALRVFVEKVGLNVSAELASLQ
jgi:hypothetical protein